MNIFKKNEKNTGNRLPSSAQSPLNFVSALRRKLRSLPCASSPHKISDFAGAPDRVKKGFRYYCSLVATVALMGCCTMTAFAADDPLTVINNLSEFIFGLIRAVGLILLGWGIVQVGLSLQSHDPSQRSNGFLTLAGGVIITFAKEILTLITGG